ncbi:MAG: hypothetical protein ACPL6C_03610 [bacterium]
MIETRTRKEGFPWKPFAIIGLVLLFLLIFPITIKEHSPVKVEFSKVPTGSESERLEALVSIYRTRGFTVKNYYPSYIQVEKSKIEENPLKLAQELSRLAYTYLGMPVRIILVTDEGRFVGYYKGE